MTMAMRMESEVGSPLQMGLWRGGGGGGGVNNELICRWFET